MTGEWEMGNKIILNEKNIEWITVKSVGCKVVPLIKCHPAMWL